jgi:hypothetical protein
MKATWAAMAERLPALGRFLASSVSSGENENPAKLAGFSSKSAFLTGLFAGLLGLLPGILTGLLALLARFAALAALLRLFLVLLVHVGLLIFKL